MGEAGAEARRLAFAAEYVANGYNATEAYQKIHPNASRVSAYSLGATYVKHPDVQAVLNKSKAKAMKKLDISVERVLQEMACLALLDISELHGEDGNLLPLTEMPEHARRAIASFESEELFEGRGQDIKHTGMIRKVKTESKTKSLEMLGKHLELFRDTLKLDATDGLAQLIVAARRRYAAPDDDVAGAEVFG